MSEDPAPVMMALTSAKSTLMSPGTCDTHTHTPTQGWPGPDVEQDGARRPGGSFRARTPPAATQVLARHLPDPF